MDGDDFHSSLQQLKQQLDFMNKRTASTLNRSHQHSNKVTHNSTQVGHFPSVIMADNAQQIKHIGATVGALVRQQEDRFQKLEHQLNLVSDKLDHLALNHPRFTPSESSNSSVHEESEPYFHVPFGKSFNTPRQPLDMPHATVADLGGYFYPNRNKLSHSDQQYISDASTFVGRVNRTLCTKSITNIEIFLRGSALRWFHVGLRTDGSHIFDGENGEMNMAKFCQSLILLFGIPDCSRPESEVEDLHLKPAFVRSAILEDYAFPALEHARCQGAVSDFEAALSKAIERYNQSSIPITVNPDIAKNKDLVSALACLRRSEFDQKLDKIVARKRQRSDNATTAKAPVENAIKAGSTRNELRHKLEDSRARIMQAQVKDCIVEDPAEEAAVAKVRIEEPQYIKSENFKVMESTEVATEPYHPGPTAESCPTTPILPCPVSASYLNGAPQMRSSREQLQGAAAMDSGEFDYSKLMSTEVAKKFGLQPGRQSTLQQRLQLKQQMHMQQMAQLHQDVMKKEKTIHTDDYPKNISRLQSSVLSTDQYPGCGPLDLDRSDYADVLGSTDNGHGMHDCFPRPKDDPAPQAGSIDIPEGAENCLAGLTFVFTGQLTNLSREQGQNLIQRYGGKCMSAPSKNTSFAVLGAQVSPKKLQSIKENGLRVIDEKGLFALISARSMQEKNKETDRTKTAVEDILAISSTDHDQCNESYINPHLYYESGCAAVQESMQANTTRLDLGPLDAQNWTSYAQMLEEHAAAVAEESKPGTEMPLRLALADKKPTWREREAAKAACGAASPVPEATSSAAPVLNRSGYIPPYLRGAAASLDSAPPVAALNERWVPWIPRSDGEAPLPSGGKYKTSDIWTQEELSLFEEALKKGRGRETLETRQK